MPLDTIGSTRAEAPAQSSVLRRRWYLLALLPVAIQVFLALYRLKHCWDDGAITTAFSRTWAESDRIALTPGSPVVEGFSSVTWFLLVSVPYFLLHHPDAGLVWMKVLSAVFALLSLRVIYLIALRQFADQTAAIASAILLAFCYTTVLEIENGMEMNLAAFLLLLLFHVLTREQEKWRVLYASIISFLLLLTRFEMPVTLGFLLCGLLYALYRRRLDAVSFGDLSRITIAITVCFLTITLWRHHEFGLWMPNTIYAKRFVPYRDWSTPAKFLGTRLQAAAEPLRILGLPILIALIVWIRAIRRRELSLSRLQRINPAIFTLALGCFLFGAAFGVNWGYYGRMIAPMMPFLILAVVGICFSSITDRLLLTKVFAAVLIVHGLLWLRYVARPTWVISMKTIEPLGTGADAIRVALHQDELVVMLTDVGSSSLCCERLGIIDAGFLANPTLSQTGWSGLTSYFRKVRPEVVETHSFWAQGPHIYEQGLLDDYSIVASKGIRFFVRNDRYRKLIDQQAGPVLPVTLVPACMPPLRADAQFSLSKGTCLVLNDPTANRNFQ
jgi:hypothetical protein